MRDPNELRRKTHGSLLLRHKLNILTSMLIRACIFTEVKIRPCKEKYSVCAAPLSYHIIQSRAIQKYPRCFGNIAHKSWAEARLSQKKVSATADGGVENLSVLCRFLVIAKRLRPLSRLTATAPLSAGEPNALSKKR